jgi:hypothetical protein
MNPSAMGGTARTSGYSSSGQIGKIDDQTGALAETKQGPVPRAQFLSVATSCFKEIGSRICKALDGAINAVNRARGGWSLCSITSGYATPEKTLSEIKFLKKLIGNDDEKLKGVIKWGTDSLSAENTLRRLEFERNAAAALFFLLEEKEVKSLVTTENDRELTTFYENLCGKVNDHYRWIIGMQNAKNSNGKNRQSST